MPLLSARSLYARCSSSRPALRVAVWASGAALVTLLALLGPAIAPFDATRNFVGPPNAEPNATHWMGTDQFGRDVLSRVIVGARVSIGAAAGGTCIALLAGAVIGSVTAIAPAIIRQLSSRLLDVTVAFPAVILAIALSTALRPSVGTTVLVLASIFTPPVARVIRGAVLAEMPKEYVESARMCGGGTANILWHHIFPNVRWQVLVFCATLMANAIIIEGGLSFLGLGAAPPTPSWGNIVSDGRSLVASGIWWVSAFGGLAIFAGTLTLTALAEAVSSVKSPGRQ